MSRPIDVVHQMSSFDCGAACLAMILRHFGRKTRLEECRDKCDPGRDGISAQTIVSAAAEFGLRAQAFAATAASLEGIALPCIVHWNRNHFVVLERWSRFGAQVVDPGEGRRAIPFEEFEKCFSGVVLRFEPGPDFDPRVERSPNPLRTYMRGMLGLPGAGRMLGQIVAASLVLQAFGFALPLLTKVLIDRVLPLGSSGALNVLAIGALFAALMQGATTCLRAHLLVRLETRLDSHLMAAFFKHLLALPFRFFQLRSTGDLLMRLSSNYTIREALANQTMSAILDGSLVIVFLGSLLHISRPFGMAALALALIQAAILLATAPRLNSLAETSIACQSASQSCLVESLMGISTLKASGAEESTLNRWSGLLSRQLGSSSQRGRYLGQIEAGMTAVRSFSPLFLLWVGGSLVLNGSLTLGTMLALNGLAAVFLQPVASFVISWQRLQFACAHLERITDVLHAAPEQSTTAVRSTPRLSGAIEVRGVSFRYDTHGPFVLRNISLTIRPGQKVALVGRTGCGKSTLAKLLLGFYSPTQGEIEYDGVPLQSMNLQSVRQQWGTALQELFLFSSSLRDNISLHKSKLTDAELLRAARIAEIDSDILQMPMGYETRIDELGQSLSGGQRQRIAIARAVAGSPSFLLLDEATSHLDTLTERAVDRNLDALSCTRVVIAHRLSTVQNADLIVVLEDGSIVEQGAHHHLLSQGGVYASLVRNQVERAENRLAEVAT